MTLAYVIKEMAKPDEKAKACREVTMLLPDWFGLPEANEKYAEGIKEAAVFAAYDHTDALLGLIALKRPFPTNADIYWMGIKPAFHRQGIGRALLKAAEAYASKQHHRTLTVETLSPVHQDPNYQQTYQFYQAMGFAPLFELEPYDTGYRMIYLIKLLMP